MERVFQKLMTAFGNLMMSKWQGIDINLVYSEWANTLGECSLGSLNHAITLSIEKEYPPNLGEFLANCKQYKPPTIENRIELKPTDADIAKERLAEIKKMMQDTANKLTS
jgi:hypothetical protein